MNGVSINMGEFRKLPIKEQNVLLFENVRGIRDMMEIYFQDFKKHERKDWFNHRIIYISIFILAGVLGATKFLFPLT